MTPIGWARRNKSSSGKLYGASYLHKYKDDIKKFFDEGKADSSNKMNPAMMEEKLRIMYPNKFSLPRETEIKQAIGTLFASQRQEIMMMI